MAMKAENVKAMGMSAMAMRVSPVLGVRQVRKTAEYYRDVLGFFLDPVDGVFQPSPDDPQGVYGIVKKGNVWIHFQVRGEDVLPRQRAVIERDVYLYVNDVESVYADLHRRGATIIQPLTDAAYGIREFVVEDLNGFRLVFGQPL